MPRQLKDSVSRALSGRLLSRPQLALFIDAFGISAQRGRAAVAAVEGLRLGRGAVRPPGGVARSSRSDLRAALGPRRHQTLSLHDHIEIGADGLLVRTRTMQVIEATAPGTDRIPYLYDTNALTLDVGQGCQGCPGELYQVGDELFATSILLAKALDVGETSTLEYWTTYQYPGDPADPHEREYRRAVMGTLENFDMRVEFHPDRLPAERVVGDLGRGRRRDHRAGGSGPGPPALGAPVPALHRADRGRLLLALVAELARLAAGHARRRAETEMTAGPDVAKLSCPSRLYPLTSH